MAVTSNAPMASLTLDGLEGLGPAENSQAMQHTTKGLSSVPVQSEQAPNISDSEDEHDTTPRALNISERRKIQNNKFSAWCVLCNE